MRAMSAPVGMSPPAISRDGPSPVQMTAWAARIRSSRCPASPKERQNRTTVASEVPAARASSVMVRVEAASGSRMISWATFVSAFDSEGRRDLMSTRRFGVSVRLAGMWTRYTRSNGTFLHKTRL